MSYCSQRRLLTIEHARHGPSSPQMTRIYHRSEMWTHQYDKTDGHDNNWLVLELLLSIPFAVGYKTKAMTLLLAVTLWLEAFTCWPYWRVTPSALHGCCRGKLNRHSLEKNSCRVAPTVLICRRLDAAKQGLVSSPSRCAIAYRLRPALLSPTSLSPTPTPPPCRRFAADANKSSWALGKFVHARSHFSTNVSVAGGLLLLAGIGAGRYTVDNMMAKKSL